jgi:hypothetical protein
MRGYLGDKREELFAVLSLAFIIHTFPSPGHTPLPCRETCLIIDMRPDLALLRPHPRTINSSTDLGYVFTPCNPVTFTS